MDKMAVFVEGQTEQHFVAQMIYAIAGRHRAHVDTVRGFGGGQYSRQFHEISVSRPAAAKEYYFLICDCSNDGRVLTDIREQYAGLVSQGFRSIIGIRDVHPRLHGEIPQIRKDFVTYTQHQPISPLLVLAVMEIEAWFIAEHSHFAKCHDGLTDDVVKSVLGFDPKTHDVEQVVNPASVLQKVYSSVGVGYKKKRKHVERTVQLLDYARLYIELAQRIPDLSAFIRCLDAFLS